MSIISPQSGEIVSNRVYHEDWPEISSSQFKAFYTAPAAYRWPMDRKPIDAWQLGTAAHTAVLQSELLNDLLMTPGAGFATKADKDSWRHWLNYYGNTDVDDIKLKDDFLSHARRIAVERDTDLVTPDQLAQAEAMAASVKLCEEAQEALKDCIVERSYRAKGRKARPDALGSALLIDLKTTSFFDAFRHKAHDLRYPESLAWYELVLRDCGVRVSYWLWIVVESTPYRLNEVGEPRHRVKVVLANDDCRREAISTLDMALDQLEQCRQTNTWPKYQTEVESLYPRGNK